MRWLVKPPFVSRVFFKIFEDILMLKKFETLSCLDMQIQFLPRHYFNIYAYTKIIYFLFSFKFYHWRAYNDFWKTKVNCFLRSRNIAYFTLKNWVNLCRWWFISCKEKSKGFISIKDQFWGSVIEAIQLICIHEVNRFLFFLLMVWSFPCMIDILLILWLDSWLFLC